MHQKFYDLEIITKDLDNNRTNEMFYKQWKELEIP
jgi:hypothetical protein